MATEYVELYQKRKKIQPLTVSGPFQTLRHITIFLALSFYFIVPWVTWDGRQAIWFDLPGRKFYIFGVTLWPQDFIILSWLLIIAALGLFIVTVIAGRIWCGYTCPQTVWTKLFLAIERFVEGERGKRIKLDNMPMCWSKFIRRSTKHFLWLLLALATAINFVGFFHPIRDLLLAIVGLDLDYWSAFWIIFLTGATYINAGWMREQVCLYMCPYARFQSVMFDKDTLVISYDYNRGEPRGPRKRTADPGQLGLGDCINCYQCVHACPTGIDIRDGLQMQCIGCAACIDACDRIMGKLGYPKKLIKYTTERVIEDRQSSPVVRGRPIAYALVLLVMCSLVGYTLFTRPLLAVDVIRDRNQLYRITNDGLVENVYQIKIMNKSQHDEIYTIETSEPSVFKYVGKNTVMVKAGGIKTLLSSVQADPYELEHDNIKIDLFVRSKYEEDVYTKRTRFIKEN